MKSAPKPPNEDSRLESLRSLNILDSLPEKDFDQIVFLASQICDTPIAVISLIDKDRQWFKSKVGLSASETPRELAFCAHAILQKDILEIPNALQDERFFDNPLVTGEPSIRFYAGAPLYALDGQPIGTVCVIDSKPKSLNEMQKRALRAISDQVTRLLELRHQIKLLESSEQSLQFESTAIKSISEGIVLQDSTGAIQDFNPAALSLLNLSADQLLGRTSFDPKWHAIREDGSPFPGEEHPAMVCLRTGLSQKNIIMGINGAQKETKWIKINAVPLFATDKKTVTHSVSSFADVTTVMKMDTDRRELESKLAESAKLSALGEMAGGVANEINNPLAIIRGSANTLRKRINDQNFDVQSAKKDIEKIEVTVDRITKIIKGLKTFSRNADNDPYIESSLNDIISETLELCREKLRLSGVQIKVKCSENFLIECSPTQISQVLMNLIGNSFDAISDLNEKWIDIEVIESLSSYSIFVKDSGQGIESAIASKIKQPFFTTKEIGKGTGLGLSISNGIIQQHGGLLEYVPNQKNTTFVFSLPKYKKAIAS
jgi:two-component system NtrC family sensor kinase